MTVARDQRRRWLALACVLALAASQALLWFAYYGHAPKVLIGDERSYQDTALAILAGGAWMPGSIWPPLQPLMLAALYSVFGVSLLAAQLFQSVLLLACTLMLRDLWRRVGAGVAAANAAAALFLINPSTAAYAHWLWPEIPHLCLLLACLCLLARAPSAWRAWVAGACIGAALLAKSLLALFWPAFLLVFVRRGRPRLLARPIAAFVIGLGLVTAPALWHGYRTYGTPMIADSSVYNLWIGLTDRWRSDYVEDLGGITLPAFIASGATPQARNAVTMDKVRTLVAERGLAQVAMEQVRRQYFRLFSAKTPLLSQLPGAACSGHLSVYATSPWLTRALTLSGDVLHTLMLVAAAFGIACWRRRPPPILLVIALLLAYSLALLLPLHVKARFLLPMIPFLCGFAGSFLAALGERGRALGSDATLALTPLRCIVGALLASLLWWLAFAGPMLDRLCAG